MKAKWQLWSANFLQLKPREQGLIFLCILVVIVFLPFNFFIDGNLIQAEKNEKKIAQLKRSNADLDISITEFSQALKEDKNKVLNDQIAQYEQRLNAIDEKLLTLTEELIDPIQMRNALIQLLNLQPGVTLMSFEVKPAEPMLFEKPKVNQIQTDKSVTEKNDENTANINNAGLYRHAIQLKLTGRYFQLRDYLKQVEDLPWQFFWHNFEYQLKEYPKSELTIEIYSLSTNKEFIGV